MIYKYGRDVSIQSVLLFVAWQDEAEGEEAPAEIDDHADLMLFMKTWPVPALPLDGEDVKNAGVKAGPEIGRVLAEAEAWWIENDFQPDRQACLEKLGELVS